MNQNASHVDSEITFATVQLRGVTFASLTADTCIQYVIRELEQGHGGWIVTPNVDILRRIVKEPQTASLISHATMLVADGMPLIWASRLQGTPLPERVAGSDLIINLSRAAAESGRSVYFLGGSPGTAEAASKILADRFPKLRIAGYSELPMGLNLAKDQTTRTQITDRLQQAMPDIVYVALGFPKQEHVIDSLRDVLPNAWWLGVGVSFSFICGQVHRAPRWMQVLGLEWVHRLVQEPGRLAKRYLIDDIPFAITLLCLSMLGIKSNPSPVQERKS